MFRALDGDANGEITPEELRRGITEALSQSDGWQHFRHDASWSGTEAAIDSVVPAQFSARVERVDLDGEESPPRESIARLAQRGEEMKEALKLQSDLEKQSQFRRQRTGERVAAAAALPPTPVGRGADGPLRETAAALKLVRVSPRDSPAKIVGDVKAAQRRRVSLRSAERARAQDDDDRLHRERLPDRYSRRRDLDRLLT